MKKFLTIFAVVVALLCGAGSAFSADYAEGEVIIALGVSQSAMSVAASDMSVFANSLSLQADSFATSVGAEAVQTYAEIARISGKNIIHLRSGSKTTEQLMNELKGDPRVTDVQPNYIQRLSVDAIPQRLPNDQRINDLWGMTKIGADKVWDTHTGAADKNDVVVAVIDTGIDYNHPDIAANMVRDSAGRPGKRFYNRGTESNDPMDIDEHGTHVAGTIGAEGNNGIGVVGVNWKVGLLAVNVFTLNPDGSLGADQTDTIKGINYILAEKRGGMKILVANMSIGGWAPAPNPLYGDAIKSMSDAGIIVAIAAGNEYQNIDSPGGPGSDPKNPTKNYRGSLPYPASFRYANTISVGATDNADVKSVFSNYSPNYVDIAAPGTGIWSTIPNSKYASFNGTSMATPHVAGAAALLFAKYPTETATQIKARLLTNADKVGLTLWKHGRLNVKAAYDQGGVIPVVTSVTISPKPATVIAGSTVTLGAAVVATSGTDTSVIWSKRDGTGSVTVLNGVVSGVSVGTADVIATSAADSTKFDTCTVTVTNTSSSSGGGCNAAPGLMFAILLAVPAAALILRKRK